MPANPAATLLSPDNHSLLTIDHQYLQMLTIRSHDASEIINHAVALVEAAAIFNVPMLTTAAFKGVRVGRASGRGDQGSQADRPDDSQFVGRSAYRRPGGEDRTEEACHRRAVDRGVRRAKRGGCGAHGPGGRIPYHDLGLCVRTTARPGTCSKLRTGHQIVRTAGRRLWPGPAVEVGPSES